MWDSRSAMPHGYGESKCVAEQLLAKAHEASGLRVNVVRAGQIGGPSKPRVKEWPRPGWIHSILQTSLKLGSFPMHVQPLDWIPVDSFAAGIVNSTKTSPSPGTLQVFNMVHPEPGPWKMLYDTLANRFGTPMETTSLSDWLDRLDQREFKLHGFLRATGNGREHNMSFRNANALQTLPEVVPLSEELLADWLRGWKLRCYRIEGQDVMVRYSCQPVITFYMSILNRYTLKVVPSRKLLAVDLSCTFSSYPPSMCRSNADIQSSPLDYPSQ